METTNTDDMFTTAELDDKANGNTSPKQEKTDTPDTDITYVRPVQQDCNIVQDMCTAESIPGMNEDTKTTVIDPEESLLHQAQTDRVQQDSDGHEAKLDLGISEATGNSMKEPECSGQKASVNNDTEGPASKNGGSLGLLSMQYRDENSEDASDSDSDSSSSTSTSSSSSSSPIISVLNDPDQDEDVSGKRPPAPVKTQDEGLIDDLPAVENLTISLPQDAETESIGIISGIIDQLVIVESKKNSPPISDESVLFNMDRLSIGKVFEVFGPVCQPYYVLRFNSQEEIEQKHLKIGDPVIYAPKIKDFTDYIFVEQMKQIKGSDASWKNDLEPPPEALDFSDDEKERVAKQKQKQQKRSQKQNLEDSDSDTESSSSMPALSQKPPRRKPRQNWNFQHGRPAHHNPHPGFYTNHQTNRHFSPDYMVPPPGPFQAPFHGHLYPLYPPPHMGPWHPSPYPGPMFYPPPPPPPPPPSH